MCLIHRYASTSNTGVVIDLDSRTVPSLEMGLLGVNRRLDDGARCIMTLEHNDVTIKMTTRKLSITINDFGALREFRRFELSRKLIRRSRSGTKLSSTEMVLKLELSEPSTLDNLRTNVTSFLSIPLVQDDFAGDITSSLTGPNAAPRGFARFAWRDLQRGLFLLLSDVLEKLPSKATKLLPRVWINNNGTILRATYGATGKAGRQSIPYRYGHIDETDVRERGY
jgi:hypothetical protein